MRNSIKDLEIRLETARGAERVEILIDLAAGYWRVSADKALMYANEALRLAGQLGYRKLEMRSLATLAMAYLEKTDCETAIKHLLEAIGIAEELGDKNGLARIFGNISIAYFVWRDLDKSLEYQLKALDLRKEFKYPEDEAKALNHLGMVYAELKDLDLALSTFQESLQLSRELKHGSVIGLALNNLGKTHLMRGEHEQAIHYLRESLALREELEDKKGTAGTLISLGEAYCKTGAHEEAAETLEKGLRVAEGLKAREFMLKGYETSATLFEKRKDYSRALDYLKKHRALRDELFNEEKSGKIAEMEARYQRAKADKEVEIQRRKNAELEKQLLQSQRLEAVGRLAGGVAHDFNNLLTAISGYTEFALADLSDGEAARSHLNQIHNAVDRAASLTRQLLAFGRKRIARPKVLDLVRVLGGMKDMLSPLVGENVNIQCSAENEAAHVVADESQIEQIIMNLAINARDAMPSGGELTMTIADVEVDAALASRSPDLERGSFVRLTVSDTGCGIEESIKPLILEPFFTTKEGEGGTGLGLSTVYGIVRQSGGAILMDSKPGKGSSFDVYLPRAEDREEIEKKAPEASEDVGGTETILLVEDQELVRSLVDAVLRTAGYKVLACGSAESALQTAESCADQIDLLLTDVALPGQNGIDLAERFRAVRPQAKVVFMSGYASSDICRGGILDSSMELIEKPFDHRTLCRRLRAVLDR